VRIAAARATRWPEPVAAEDYGAVRDAYISRLLGSGAVKAVYQVGSVGAPGLSDLDLFVVLKEPVPRAVDQLARIGAGGPRERYVLKHGQFLVNEETFRRLPALFLGSNVRRVWGEGIAVPSLPSEEERPLRFLFNVDMMTKRLAGFVRDLEEEGTLPVRPTIAHLNSVRFNIALAREWTDTAPHEDYAEQVDRLRAEWFGLDRSTALERLGVLLRRARDVLGGLLEAAGREAARWQRAPGRGRVNQLVNRELQRYEGERVRATLTPNPLRLLLPPSWARRRPWVHHAGPIVRLELPATLFVLQCTRARVFARLGRRGLASRVRGEAPEGVDPALEAALVRNAEAASGALDFLRRSRLQSASHPVPLPWQSPYPPSYRLRARVLSWLVR